MVNHSWVNYWKVKVGEYLFFIVVFTKTTITSISLLRGKICLDKKSSESTGDVSERVVIDDELIRKCPGVDRLRADTREKMKTYLQEQVIRQKKTIFSHTSRCFSYSKHI